MEEGTPIKLSITVNMAKFDAYEMTVKKKAIKPKQLIQYNIDDIINRGGKVSADSKQQINEEAEEEIRFTLRISQKLIHKIDKDRKSRIGNVSRNQWIIEAIAEKIH